MRLSLQQEIAVVPEVVWPFVTEPELMNRWSEAKIRLLAPGDGGGADGVGTYREVCISAFGRTSKLREVIVDADAPRCLVYRVVEAPFVRAHRGAIALERRGASTSLRWDVEYELLARGADWAMKQVLESQLKKSLESLAREAAAAGASAGSSAPVKPSRVFEDRRVHPRLWTAAEEILLEQRELADRLEAAGDPKRWFSRVYAYVTEAQLSAARLDRVAHVGWVLRLVPRFHTYYLDNLRRRTGELSGRPEPQWIAAFDAMEGARRKKNDPRRALFFGLLGGIRAHIEEDLPRALAEVYVADYADRCDYARFRADYLAMGGIFRESSARLLSRVPRNYLPWYTRWFGGLIPEELAESMQNKNFYDITRERRLAFERGERIAELLLRERRPQGSPS